MKEEQLIKAIRNHVINALEPAIAPNNNVNQNKGRELRMKNTLGDLNNHLFAQLERISDEEIKGEKLEEEIKRAKSINDVATRIIANGRLALDAERLQDDRMSSDTKVPKMLLLEKDKNGQS